MIVLVCQWVWNMPQTLRDFALQNAAAVFKMSSKSGKGIVIDRGEKSIHEKQMFHCASVVYAKCYIPARAYTKCNFKKSSKIPKG